jgi:hypothetical protein
MTLLASSRGYNARKVKTTGIDYISGLKHLIYSRVQCL